MKVEEIIQRVQSLYSKGVQSDDTRLSSRHIYSVLLSVRSMLITQKINKRQFLSRWIYQTLNCVELIKAEPYECPCLPSIGCEILRTKFPLPKPLSGLIQGHIIDSVTSLDGSIIYSETTWKAKKYKKGNKYTADKPDYYIKDDYLYITTSRGPKAIAISGIFEDPVEVESYPNICGNEDCKECIDCGSALSKDFQIDKDMERSLIQLASEELLELFSRGREDITNNSKDNSNEETK